MGLDVGFGMGVERFGRPGEDDVEFEGGGGGVGHLSTKITQDARHVHRESGRLAESRCLEREATERWREHTAEMLIVGARGYITKICGPHG